MWKIKILIMIVGLIGLAEVYGQSRSRLEFEIKPNESQPEIVPVNNLGFMIFNPGKEKKQEGLSHLKLSFYDTNFKHVWEKIVTSNKKLNLNFYEYFDGAFYLIFSNNTKEDLEVVKIDPETSEINNYKFYVVRGTQINDFVVKNNKMIIGGSIKNVPLIQQLDLVTLKTKTLPSIIEGKSVEVQEVFVNAQTNTVNAVISSKLGKNKIAIVRTFRDPSNKFDDLVIRSDKKYDFHTAKVTSISPFEKLVMGSFGLRKSDNTQGFYIAKFVEEEQRFLKFYSFTELDNFFGFLGDREQTRVENKAERKKQKGKDLKIQYRLLMHELVKQNDQYVMIGEAYYPVFRRERFVDYYGYRRYYNYRTVFDGNQFTHAIIAGFSEDGDLIWDNSFKINDIKTKTLKERVKAYVESNNITLFYNLEGKINKLTIHDNNVDTREETMALTTEYENDQVKKANIGAAEYWYDNYFIAWGYQKIKNDGNIDVKKKRNIFYINKMSF